MIQARMMIEGTEQTGLVAERGSNQMPRICEQRIPTQPPNMQEEKQQDNHRYGGEACQGHLVLSKIWEGGEGVLSADGHDVGRIVLVPQLQSVVPLRIESARCEWALQVEHTAAIWRVDFSVLVRAPGVIHYSSALQPFFQPHRPIQSADSGMLSVRTLKSVLCMKKTWCIFKAVVYCIPPLQWLGRSN